MKLFTVLLLCASLHCGFTTDPEVSLKYGHIRGTKRVVGEKEVNVFLGLPFAEPPVGELRFKKSVPITKKWENIVEAKTWPNACIQVPGLSELLAKTSEDCLYLNVWTPTDLKSDFSNNLKPVLVWIHGGGFLFGSSSREVFEASLLSSSQDLIVVTINYRLGAFGFLFGDSDDIPGNMGLYDQALALEWVQENIAYFGGDKSMVTIFGLSAGGMSVSQHLTSPFSQSFYKRAIIASGVSVDDFTLDSKQTALKKAKIFANSVGCKTNIEDSAPLSPSTVECLRKVDANDLLAQQMNDEIIRSTRSFVRVPFWPVHGEAFIPKMNQELWKEKKFKQNSQLLIGTLPNDAFAVIKLKSNDLNLNNRIDVVLTDIMNNFMSTQVSINADDILKMYTSNIDLSNKQQSKKALFHSLNDVLFDCPSLMLAKQYSVANDVYYYVFNYHAVDAEIELSKVCEIVTPCHAFDEFFAFGVVSEDNKAVSREWMQIIAQFVKTGTVPWPKYQKTSKDKLIQFYYTFNGGNSSYVDIGYKTNICNILNQFLFTKL